MSGGSTPARGQRWKYEGYIKRQLLQVERLRRLEDKMIPDDLELRRGEEPLDRGAGAAHARPPADPRPGGPAWRWLDQADFPRQPLFLNDIALAPSTDQLYIYISDYAGGRIFKRAGRLHRDHRPGA